MEPSEATVRTIRGVQMALRPAVHLFSLHKHYVWCKAEAEKVEMLAKQLRQAVAPRGRTNTR